jgi:ketosteroid isomerase-like protein
MLPVTGVLALASCTGEESPRSFADKFIEAENKAWNTGNVDDLKALERDDVVYHMPGLEVRGWKAHEDYILQNRPKISDLKQHWQYLDGEGNHFAMAYDSSAMMRGDEKTPAASAASNYLFFFQLKDKKVAEVWVNGSTTTTPLAESQAK